MQRMVERAQSPGAEIPDSPEVRAMNDITKAVASVQAQMRTASTAELSLPAVQQMEQVAAGLRSEALLRKPAAGMLSSQTCCGAGIAELWCLNVAVFAVAFLFSSWNLVQRSFPGRTSTNPAQQLADRAKDALKSCSEAHPS